MSPNHTPGWRDRANGTVPPVFWSGPVHINVRNFGAVPYMLIWTSCFLLLLPRTTSLEFERGSTTGMSCADGGASAGASSQGALPEMHHQDFGIKLRVIGADFG